MHYFMKPYNNENEEVEDDYSPTSWEKTSNESQEDYEDRIQDQEDFLEALND